MKLFSVIATCAFTTVTLAGGVASAHPNGNGQNNSSSKQNQGSSFQNFQKIDKSSKPFIPNKDNWSGNNNSEKFFQKTKFKVAPLNKNGKLKLAWSKYKVRHHHHHHRLHWCDCDFIDMCDCPIADQGVQIEQLYDGTANDEGMNVGDVILDINGKAIPDIETLRDVVSNAGEVIDMVYINGETGETESISLYPQDGKIGIYGNSVPVNK